MAKEIVTNNGISHNALASGSHIKGNIVCDSDFRVDGSVEGKIDCTGRVVIGPNGALVGDINCLNADIMGTLNGNIKVTDTLSLKSTAKVYGDIKTKVLVIEPEAIFCGTCDMGAKNSSVKEKVKEFSKVDEPSILTEEKSN
ncbi:MAG: polymer-forming cytoskeletal protein [Paludibacteraceae bacterium]|nr:polymer-forming cytoskeletal protein [Paludibacteraceae bacterium]MBN2788357.1 polymer-forming cytoskeletal protein [Paludibacteraceae bacterium]